MEIKTKFNLRLSIAVQLWPVSGVCPARLRNAWPTGNGVRWGSVGRGVTFALAVDEPCDPRYGNEIVNESGGVACWVSAGVSLELQRDQLLRPRSALW